MKQKSRDFVGHVCNTIYIQRSQFSAFQTIRILCRKSPRSCDDIIARSADRAPVKIYYPCSINFNDRLRAHALLNKLLYTKLFFLTDIIKKNSRNKIITIFCFNQNNCIFKNIYTEV